MAIVLYARVSSIGQNLDRQLQDSDKYDRIFEDKCSGKNTDRPALQEMLNYIREGDEVYAHELSRLGCFNSFYQRKPAFFARQR